MTTSVSAATINAALAADGEYELPAGITEVDGAIVPVQGCRITGAGRNRSVLRAATGYNGSLIVDSDSGNTVGGYYFAHFELDGQSRTSRGILLGTAIAHASKTGIVIEDLYVHDCAVNNIECIGCAGIKIHNVESNDSHGHGGGGSGGFGISLTICGSYDVKDVILRNNGRAGFTQRTDELGGFSASGTIARAYITYEDPPRNTGEQIGAIDIDNGNSCRADSIWIDMGMSLNQGLDGFGINYFDSGHIFTNVWMRNIDGSGLLSAAGGASCFSCHFDIDTLYRVFYRTGNDADSTLSEARNLDFDGNDLIDSWTFMMSRGTATIPNGQSSVSVSHFGPSGSTPTVTPQAPNGSTAHVTAHSGKSFTIALNSAAVGDALIDWEIPYAVDAYEESEHEPDETHPIIHLTQQNLQAVMA